MWKWLAPLGIFIVGMVSLAFFWLFSPAMEESVDNLSASTSAIAENYWGWEWLMSPGVVIFLIFFMIICIILWHVFTRWLKRR